MHCASFIVNAAMVAAALASVTKMPHSRSCLTSSSFQSFDKVSSPSSSPKNTVPSSDSSATFPSLPENVNEQHNIDNNELEVFFPSTQGVPPSTDLPNQIVRDVSLIRDALSQVQLSLSRALSTLQRYKGRADNDNLIRSNNGVGGVRKVMRRATAQISQSDPISLSGALRLRSPLQELAETAQSVMGQMRMKKKALQAGGAMSDVVSSAYDMRAMTLRITDVIVSKLPSSIQSYGDTAKTSIRQHFDRAINELRN